MVANDVAIKGLSVQVGSGGPSRDDCGAIRAAPRLSDADAVLPQVERTGSGISRSAHPLRKGKRWLLGGSPVIKFVTTPSIPLRWGNCAAILDGKVSFSSETPGACLHAVVDATRPCHCGTSARTVVR